MSFALNRSYIGLRGDVVEVLLDSGIRPRTVLDVGCATGEMGRSLKEHFGATVHGVEPVAEMAAIAQTKLDYVFTGLAEDFVGQLDPQATYDTIILADVLEHTIDPWTLLAFFRSRLAPGGIIVISMPNVRHWSTIFRLAILGDWPHRDRGIHDRTHLRFFTLRNMRDLVSGAGLMLLDVHRNLRIDEGFGRINAISSITNIPGIRAFFVFQYILTCKAA